MFKIVNWNIKHGKGADGVVDIWRIAKTLKALDADIYTIQEVDRISNRSGNMDQATILEEQLEMPGFFTPISRVPDGTYGLVTLTKWPVKIQTNVMLTDSPQNNSFQMLEMKINDVPLKVINLHAPWKTNQSYWQRFSMHVQPRTIISGDFNLLPHDLRIKAFQKKYKWLNESGTYQDGSIYDYTFIPFKIQEQYVQQTDQSDHHILITTFHF